MTFTAELINLLPFLITLVAFMLGILSIFIKGRRAFNFSFVVLFAINALISILLLCNHASFTLSIFIVNAFSLLIFAIFSIFLMLISLASIKEEKPFMFLISMVYIAVLLVAFSRYIITVAIGIEFSAISSVFLVLAGKSNREAAIKLFIMSAITISLIAMALSILLAYNGTMQLVSLSISSISSFLLFAMILLAAALSIDAAQFPFNLWIPDVYEGAPTNVTSLLASVSKGLPFVAILLIFSTLFIGYVSQYSQIFEIFAILTMFFGNIVAIIQKNVKRMLAYSSISQAGYIMVGIAVASTFGFSASIFQLFSYGIMAICAFSIVQVLEIRGIKSIDEYAGLNKRNGTAAFSLSISLLSMAGMPPLVGFASKFFLFASAIDNGMILLAGLGILNSFISIYYYGNLISAIYEDKPQKRIAMPIEIKITALFCLLIAIVIGIYPYAFTEIAKIAISSI
ncbi:MAG: NADH-quinone oxidoreductase subunit N [Candidatus Micrarchaeaceae archaeon]